MDFKNLSIGAVFDFLEIQVKIDNDEDIHEEEKRYFQMLNALPTIEERHNTFVNGERIISDKRYNNWMRMFKELEEKYG